MSEYSPYHWQDLDLGHLPEIMDLQKKVAAALPPGFYVEDSKDSFAALLQGQGHISGVRDATQGMRLVGCAATLFPTADSAANLGTHMGFGTKELGEVAHLDSAFVLPEYRGQALATHLSQNNIEKAAQKGRCRVLATAYPGNRSSLRNLFSLNMVVRAFAHKYGGLERFILHRELGLRPEQSSVRVAALDIQGHKAALAQGLAGFAVTKDAENPQCAGGFWLHYGYMQKNYGHGRLWEYGRLRPHTPDDG